MVWNWDKEREGEKERDRDYLRKIYAIILNI